MNLIIENPDNVNLNDFCSWLKPIIIDYANNAIIDKKLVRFNKYVNNDINIKWFANKPLKINCKDVLLAGLNNLVYKRQGNDYIIEIDANNYIYNSSAKFIDIIKLINYGNMVLSAYPIVDKIFDYITENLETYYSQYLQEVNS